MHHTQALKTLLQCLEELTTTIDKFGTEEKLHTVEKDLVLYRGRLLYEAILKLPEAAGAAEGQPAEILQQLAEEAAALPETEEPEAATFSTEKEPVTAEAESSETEVYPENEPAQEEKELKEPGPDLEIEQLVITVTAEKTADQTPEPKVTLQYNRFSIAEVLKLSGDKDLILTHLKLKPIHDLKSGIGLNEKFLFIRELFANDHQAYADAVDALNSRANVEEAEAYIASELLPRYGWEMEKEALVNFLHLILRRFSAQ